MHEVILNEELERDGRVVSDPAGRVEARFRYPSNNFPE